VSSFWGSGHLDYDGFRDGEFQIADGWQVSQQDLLHWHHDILHELGFQEHEIDDVNYSYGRMILERKYPEKYLAIYPQETAIVDLSVSLEVDPQPDFVYRLWLYFIPTDQLLKLPAPRLRPVERRGFSVIELGYLTNREIPESLKSRVSGGCIAAGHSYRRKWT
jgi:hypothetical protein